MLSSFIAAIWPAEDGYNVELKRPQGTTVYRMVIRPHAG
jgi:hypothetical protein